jgi:hypothetical protein
MRESTVQAGIRAQARAQVLLIMVLVPVLVLVMFIAATYIYQEDSRGGRLVKDADRAQALLRQQIDDAAASLHVVLDGLQDDPQLVKALAAGDSDALQHRIATNFIHLRDQHGISHLYFTRPDRSPLLRLVGAGKSGQVVERLDLFDVAENAGQADGIDLNAFGVVTLRVSAGWRDADGKLLGFVEIGRDVAPMVDAVHRVMGLDIIMLVKKEMLDRDRWDEGERQAGGQGDWDELANAVSVARTVTTIPTQIGLLIEDGQPDKTGATIVAVGKKSLAVSVRPLIDLQKKSIGEVVLLRDVTEASHAMVRTLTLMIVFAGLLILAGFWRVRLLLKEE